MTKILLNAGSSGPNGWSRGSQILRCGQRTALIDAGYVEGDREALVKGSLVHIGSAHFHARVQAVQQGWEGDVGDPTPGPDAYYTPLEALTLLAESEGPSWLEHTDIAAKAVKKYEREQSAFPEYVIAVEQLVHMEIPKTLGPRTESPLAREVAASLPDTIIHSMRIDLVVHRAGKYYIVDHKTQSNPRAKGTLPFDLSGQVIAMDWWGRKTWGEDFGGVEINAINLTSGFVDRRTPRVAPHAVRRWPQTRTYIEVLRAVNRSLYGAESLAWPMALSDQGPCYDRYGLCGFRETCRLGLPERGE